METDTLIQAAHPVTLQIDRHVLISDRTQLLHNTLAQPGLEGARQLVTSDFQAGERIVMPHAADTEAEVAQHVFGTLDHAQLLVGHLGMVRNARGETRRCGLVPCRQARAAGKLADFSLGQIHLVERAAHAELSCRRPARAIVTTVVGVVAVEDDRNAAIAGDARQRGVQLAFAVVTAIDGVGSVLGTVELRGVNDLVAQTELARDTPRELAVTVGITGAVGGDAERTRTEGLGSRPGEIGTVNAAAERNDRGIADGQQLVESGLLFRQRPAVRHAVSRRALDDPMCHSSTSSSSSSSSSSRSSSSSSSSSSRSSSSSSRSSSSSSSSEKSSSSGPPMTRFLPHSGQLTVSPSSKSSVSISS